MRINEAAASANALSTMRQQLTNWKFAPAQQTPFSYPLRGVQAENPDSCSSGLCNRPDEVCINAEVIRPTIPARMEKANGLSRFWIDRSDVGTLIAIAGNAGICQIIEAGRSAVFTADYVVNLVRESGVVFVNEAILTAIFSAARNVGADLPANVTGHAGAAGELLPSPFSRCVQAP